MILLLNGSPKLKNSNSNFFLKQLKLKSEIKYLYKESFDNIVKDLNKYNTIILSFPLYLDGPPSRVIELIEDIKNNNINIKDKNIYVISNCGFLEANQNKIAVSIIKNFCLNNKAKYMGSFKIGSGEIIGKCNKIKIYRLMSIPFYYKINKFRKAIIKKNKIELKTTIRPMTKKLYIYLANKSWRKKLKKNNYL